MGFINIVQLQVIVLSKKQVYLHDEKCKRCALSLGVLPIQIRFTYMLKKAKDLMKLPEETKKRKRK